MWKCLQASPLTCHWWEWPGVVCLPHYVSFCDCSNLKPVRRAYLIHRMKTIIRNHLKSKFRSLWDFYKSGNDSLQVSLQTFNNIKLILSRVIWFYSACIFILQCRVGSQLITCRCDGENYWIYMYDEEKPTTTSQLDTAMQRVWYTISLAPVCVHLDFKLKQ